MSAVDLIVIKQYPMKTHTFFITLEWTFLASFNSFSQWFEGLNCDDNGRKVKIDQDEQILQKM